MAKLEVTLKNDQGQIISQLPVIELELGKGRLDEIETAVEEMRKNLLPEISSELLKRSQKTFTEEKKRVRLNL